MGAVTAFKFVLMVCVVVFGGQARHFEDRLQEYAAGYVHLLTVVSRAPDEDRVRSPPGIDDPADEELLAKYEARLEEMAREERRRHHDKKKKLREHEEMRSHRGEDYERFLDEEAIKDQKAEPSFEFNDPERPSVVLRGDADLPPLVPEAETRRQDKRHVNAPYFEVIDPEMSMHQEDHPELVEKFHIKRMAEDPIYMGHHPAHLTDDDFRDTVDDHDDYYGYLFN